MEKLENINKWNGSAEYEIEKVRSEAGWAWEQSAPCTHSISPRLTSSGTALLGEPLPSPSLPPAHHVPWNPLDWDTELAPGSTDSAMRGARKLFCSGQGMRLQSMCSQPCSLPASFTWKPSAIDVADIILTIVSTIIKPVNISAWGTTGRGWERVGQGWLSIPTLLKEVRISRGTYRGFQELLKVIKAFSSSIRP